MKKTDLDPSPSLSIPTVPVVCDRCRAEGAAGDPAFSAIADILNFTPVPRRVQANGWSAEHQRAFIAALAISGSARKAAATVGKHVFGADTLRKSRGGRSFADAWDAALDIAREREMARVYDSLAELRAEDESGNARGECAAGGGGEWDDLDDGEAAERAYQETQERIRAKLLGARRLALAFIAEDPEMRSAWEVLVGWVDWDKAKRLQPQEYEPFETVNMRNNDMVLTAEAGWFNDMIGKQPNMNRIFLEMAERFRKWEESGGAEPKGEIAKQSRPSA